MKNLKKILAVLLVLLVITGCTSKKEGGDGEVVELLMYQVGDEPEYFKEVMEKVNAISEEEIGVRVNLQYIGWGEWGEKMNMIVSSGEAYDLSFSENFAVNAQKGAYADLTDLIEEHASEYFDSIDDIYKDGNIFDDKLYGFPVNANVYAQQMLTFNKELLDKHNLSLDGINGYADIETLLSVIKEKEPQTVPYAVGRGYKVALGNFDYLLSDSLPYAVDVDGDQTKIVNVFETPQATKNLEIIHGYYNKGYIPVDAATSDTSYGHGENTWFVRQETQGPMDYGDYMLSTVAGKELVSVPVTDMLKSTAQARMANFVVSNNSKHKVEAVKFLNLINTNEEVLNTLIHGIEGEHWTYDDATNRITKKIDKNVMSPWNTGNNKLIYVTDVVTDEMIKERDVNIEAAVSSPIVGFNFDTNPVKNELSAVQTVMERFSDTINTGTKDPKVAVPEFLKELEANGSNKIIEEMQKQYDAWRK
ncbi:MAG: extracellular solute-binding protein [Erysipelothrix sp.]|nr:extracellular solute-binding protein [Erysipelothrix sp.]